MTIRFHLTLLIVAGSLAFCENADASSLNKKTEADFGRAISIAMPVAAYTISYLHHEDWVGMKELTVVTAATIGSAFLARQFIHRRSPDGSTDRSFPSLEASVSAPAEGYLWRRYGWEYGVPALILQQGANLLLDNAGKHRFLDGLAVTALAAGFNWAVTTRYRGARLSYGAYPCADGIFVGMRMAF